MVNDPRVGISRVGVELEEVVPHLRVNRGHSGEVRDRYAGVSVRDLVGLGDLFLDHPAGGLRRAVLPDLRSEEHTSELQSLMRISYAVFCLKKKKRTTRT